MEPTAPSPVEPIQAAPPSPPQSLTALRPAQGLAASAGMSPQPAPGFTTTEFWLIAGVVLLTIGGGLAGRIPPEFAGIMAMFTSLGYAGLRGMVKADHNEQFVNLMGTVLDAQAMVHPSGGTPLPLSGADGAAPSRIPSADSASSKTESKTENAPPVAIGATGGFASPRIAAVGVDFVEAEAAAGAEGGFVLPRVVAALSLLSFALLSVAPSLLTGCAQVQSAGTGISNAIASPTGQKVVGTLEVVGIDALKITAQSLLNSAVSGSDATVKSDYLYSAASGLATQALSVNAGADVASIVKLWTPAANPAAPQHWSDLAESAAQSFNAALAANPGTPKADVVQALAVTLQTVAKTGTTPPTNSDGLPMLRTPMVKMVSLGGSGGLENPRHVPRLRARPLPELRPEPAEGETGEKEEPFIYFPLIYFHWDEETGAPIVAARR